MFTRLLLVLTLVALGACTSPVTEDYVSGKTGLNTQEDNQTLAAELHSLERKTGVRMHIASGRPPNGSIDSWALQLMNEKRLGDKAVVVVVIDPYMREVQYQYSARFPAKLRSEIEAMMDNAFGSALDKCYPYEETRNCSLRR
jgi:uncharacterized membrane protein YgcG